MRDYVNPKLSTPTLNHVLPLREATEEKLEVDAAVTLPRDLTCAEAERICIWIKTLARD